MRVSKPGLVVGAAYAVLATASVIYGSSLSDPKEGTVLMQLPLLPALLLLVAMGLDRWLLAAPWFIGCGLLISANAVALYAACWLFGATGARTRLVIGLGTLVVVSWLLLWPVTR